MKEIPLTQGMVALVDDDDYEKLSQFSWCASWTGRKWYAVRRLPRPEKFKIGKKIYMHRVIMDTGFQVDHKNGDGLDNRKENLRSASNSQNGMNRGKAPSNTTGYKGVQKYKDRWRAYIKHNGSNQIFLGTFHSKEDAALAYDAAAKRYHGEYARLNFPDVAA